MRYAPVESTYPGGAIVASAAATTQGKMLIRSCRSALRLEFSLSSTTYSYRSARFGSIVLARTAGYQPRQRRQYCDDGDGSAENTGASGRDSVELGIHQACQCIGYRQPNEHTHHNKQYYFSHYECEHLAW